MELFDQNCPAYFAPNERADFETYLRDSKAEYSVYVQDKQVIASYGLHICNERFIVHLRWIMVALTHHGKGTGTRMMHEAIENAKTFGFPTMTISASQHSEPFFARFGAVKQSFQENGFGPGMHRIEMQLPLET
jgi:N-acetylglutamate synthase-like GNAT family acetyltransferase